MPSNWSAAKLKTEIAALGVNFTSQSIPKSALLQIYGQLSSVKDSQNSGNNDDSADVSIPAKELSTTSNVVTSELLVTPPVPGNVQDTIPQDISRHQPPVSQPACVPGSSLDTRNSLSHKLIPRSHNTSRLSVWIDRNGFRLSKDPIFIKIPFSK